MNRSVALLLAFLLGASASGRAQETTGPLPPPPTFEVKRLPTQPNATPPPLPAEEIIHRFAGNEDAYREALRQYNYRQTVRVQEFEEDGSRGGEFQMAGELVVHPDGERYERVVSPPGSTLRHTIFTLEDVKALAALPLFVLTTDQLGKYDLTYQGQQKLDELTTYIFRVKPKSLERGPRYFEGVVWVDTGDFAIVKSYGRFVTQAPPGEPPPFTMFETYREFIDKKYWFPTYTRSDEVVKSGKIEYPIRLVIRSADFKPVAAGSNPAPAEAAKPNPPRPPER
jgi:hypothetical protein